MLKRVASFALFLMLALAGRVSATTYYVSTSGSDSSSGTTEGAPWAHLPGMATWTGKHTPVPGDTFILRGCDDWGNANFPVNWSWSGTSGTHITVGVDQTWYNTSTCPSGWNRPKFDAGGAVIAPPECTNQNDFLTISGSYIDFDWIELTGFHWASSHTGDSCYGRDYWIWGPGAGGNGVTINYFYIHNWTLGSGAGDIDNGLLNECITCTINYTVIDNSDGTKYTGIGDRWSTLHSVITYVANAYKPINGGEFGSNNISHLSAAVSGVHPNCIESVGSNPAHPYYIHDNLIHDMTGPSEECETLQISNSNETDYIWNNIWYNTGGGDIMRLPQSSGGTALYFFNNTWVTGPDTGVCGDYAGAYNNWSGAFVFVNNLCLTANPPTGTSQSQGMLSGTSNISGAATVVVSNNIVQTIATMISSGLNNTEAYVYSPASGTAATVGMGVNLTSTYWPAGFSTNDTSYACAEQNVSGVVQSVCPGRSSNTRPSTGAWDVGAYEFGNASNRPAPPSAVTATVQ